MHTIIYGGRLQSKLLPMAEHLSPYRRLQWELSICCSCGDLHQTYWIITSIISRFKQFCCTSDGGLSLARSCNVSCARRQVCWQIRGAHTFTAAHQPVSCLLCCTTRAPVRMLGSPNCSTSSCARRSICDTSALFMTAHHSGTQHRFQDLNKLNPV
jgi:hypothetical protein